MHEATFTGCCAGLILYDFGGTPVTQGYKGSYSQSEIESYLKEQEEYYDQKGFFLIAINDVQNKFMAPILKKLDYKCVGKDIKSPGHQSSKIFLYLKTI